MTLPSGDLHVHQFLPTWEPGAIGTHALGVHETLVEAGISCTSWASDIRPGLSSIVRPAADFFADASKRPNSILLYHTAVGAEICDALLARTEPLVLDHHNVTPPEYFDHWHPALAENLELGEAQVARLARRAVLGIADSEFNADQLRDLGCERTAVAPVFLAMHKPCDVALAELLRAANRGINWLFVGRVAPNKAPHEVVRAFGWFRRVYDADARLWLVGGSPADGYAATVQRLIERLDLADAVVMTGSITDAELGAYYRTADVFVCLSRHEGFGVPIIEAMAAGVPVIALDSAAVGETTGGAALLVDRTDPALVAGAVARVSNDQPLRDAFIAAGRERAETFSREHVARRWLAIVDQLRTFV